MADKKNPFLEGLEEDNPFLQGLDPSAEPDAIKTVPIDDDQRLILQNVFDTQPKKRKAYLEQLGWEMNDKNDNLIRPLGSQIAWSDAEKIDPGVGDLKEVYKKGAASKHFAGGLMAVAKETSRDVTDVLADTIASTASGVGGAAGLAAGGGPTPAGIGLAILGGAAGEAAAEVTKQSIADMILEKEIPTDKSSVIIQSLLGGTFNAATFVPGIRNAMRKGGAAVNDFLANKIASTRKELTNIISKNGGASVEFLEKYAKNPELYDPKATESATTQIRDTYRKLFGLDPEKALPTRAPKKIQRDSVFGQKLRPLNDEADLEIARIMKDPDATVTFGDYIEQLNPEMGPLMQKLKAGERLTQQETDAINAFNKEILELGEQAGVTQKEVVKGTAVKKLADGKETVVTEKGMQALAPEEVIQQISDKPMSFATLENNIDVLQDKAFRVDPVTGREAEIPEVAMVAGRLRRYRDEVANKSFKKAIDEGQVVRRPLTDIKAEQSKILSAYNTASQMGKPDKIMQAFKPQVVGNASDSVAKEDVREALKAVDSVLGTKMEEEMTNGVFQKSIEDMHKNYAMGSSNVQALKADLAKEKATEGAAKGAAIGSAIGGTVGGFPGLGAGSGLGTAAGYALGHLEGNRLGSRLATPGGALGALSENALEERLRRSRADALREAAGSPIFLPLETPIASTVTGAVQRQSLTPALDRLLPVEEEEKNPFLEGL